MAILKGMSEEVKGQSYKIDQDEIFFGRGDDLAIVLKNPTVSGKHCSISREGDRYILKDLNSTNGTRVNSQPITETTLSPKDLIQVGSVEFMFDAEYAGEVVETSSFAETQVVVSSEPTEAPESFGSISPFGGRTKDSKGAWYLLMAILAILTLAGVALFFFKLVMSS